MHEVCPKSRPRIAQGTRLFGAVCTQVRPLDVPPRAPLHITSETLCDCVIGTTPAQLPWSSPTRPLTYTRWILGGDNLDLRKADRSFSCFAFAWKGGDDTDVTFMRRRWPSWRQKGGARVRFQTTTTIWRKRSASATMSDFPRTSAWGQEGKDFCLQAPSHAPKRRRKRGLSWR